MNKSLLNLPIVASTAPRRLTMTMLAAALCAFAISGCDSPKPIDRQATEFDLVTTDDANVDIGTYVLPQDTSILKEPNADQIFFGKRLLNETKRLLPEHVGAQMNCNSCHISQGKIPLATPISTASIPTHG